MVSINIQTKWTTAHNNMDLASSRASWTSHHSTKTNRQQHGIGKFNSRPKQCNNIAAINIMAYAASSHSSSTWTTTLTHNHGHEASLINQQNTHNYGNFLDKKYSCKTKASIIIWQVSSKTHNSMAYVLMWHHNTNTQNINQVDF
jgi:hypothetical protein